MGHASSVPTEIAEKLVDMPTDKLLAARYEKFRSMGQFLEGRAADSRAAPKTASRRSFDFSASRRMADQSEKNFPATPTSISSSLQSAHAVDHIMIVASQYWVAANNYVGRSSNTDCRWSHLESGGIVWFEDQVGQVGAQNPYHPRYR